MKPVFVNSSLALRYMCAEYGVARGYAAYRLARREASFVDIRKACPLGKVLRREELLMRAVALAAKYGRCSIVVQK